MLGIGSLAIENNLRVLTHLRTEIDLKGLPPLKTAGPVATSVVDNYLKVSWDGGGVLETSPDLNVWTPVPWASGPFLESMESPPATPAFLPGGKVIKFRKMSDRQAIREGRGR